MDMLHGVYLAAQFLGESFLRVSAYMDRWQPEGRVEDIALARFEGPQTAALVNVGWGLGPGGIEISGTQGRVSIRYADGGTPPWASLEQILVVDEERVRNEPILAEMTLDKRIETSISQVVADFAGAALENRTPRTTARDGTQILNSTLAAYTSAATGVSTGIPLDTNHPVHAAGVLALNDLDLPPWSPIKKRQLFLA